MVRESVDRHFIGGNKKDSQRHSGQLKQVYIFVIVHAPAPYDIEPRTAS
jgi:hypothetical protein